MLALNMFQFLKYPVYGSMAITARLIGMSILLNLPARAQELSRTITVQHLQRNFLYHLPEKRLATHPLPLVFVLHGGGSEARRMPRFTGMDSIADREKFIVVYPQGYHRHWNDGRKDINESVDDIAFFQAMINYFEEHDRIDPRRIYATGISNGGFMVQRLACEMSTQLAAVASVAATMSEDLAVRCKPAQPISVLFMNGTSDPIVPYQGGEVHIGRSKRGAVLSTQQAVEKWLTTDGCADEPIQDTLADRNPFDHTRVYRTRYMNCRQGTAVELYTIAGGGHTWPGGPQYLPARIVGWASRDINASEIIWQFFAAHPQNHTASD
jgi:polyhydroxybutyrate depolymerase